MEGSVYPDCMAIENEHTLLSKTHQVWQIPKERWSNPHLELRTLSATDKASRKKGDWSSGDSNNKVDLLSISTLSHFTGRYLITFPVSL